LNGFFGLSVTQLVLLIVIGGVATVYALIRLSEKKPATDEPIVGYTRFILLPNGEEVLGWTSLAEKIRRDTEYISKLVSNDAKTLAQFELFRKCSWYGVRDEATSAIGDKTLILSTMPIGLGSAYSKAIHSQRSLILGGRPYNYLLVEGHGQRAAKFDEWNIAWIIPRDLSNPAGALGTPDPKLFEQFNEMCKLLGESANFSRRATLNTSVLREKDQAISDRDARHAETMADFRKILDERDLALKGASRPDLRQYPPPAEPTRRGFGPIWMYGVALIAGYFVGSNFFAGNFASPEQAGFVVAIVALVTLYFIQRRKLI